jgi:uncharacterized protein
MSLHQTIKDEVKKSMIARDELRTMTLRGVLAAYTNEIITKKVTGDVLGDDDALAVIKRLVKQRKDSIDQFTKGGRPELADAEVKEMKILEAFLPASMPKDEIRKVAEAMKAKLAVADKSGAGKLIGAISKELKGKAEGSDIKEVVDNLFA